MKLIVGAEVFLCIGVYQGEELGMTNVPFDDIADFRDIESLRYYADAVGMRHQEPETVLATLRRTSRDNARTPMQWTAGPSAGFTAGTPWIPVHPTMSGSMPPSSEMTQARSSAITGR